MSFGGFEQGPGQPMADINTTPLVDVMLVLLVIFIITAPLFTQSVPIDLPKVSASEMEEKPELLHVALDAAGQLYLDDTPITLDAMEARFQSAAQARPIPELRLRADRDTRYEAITRIMALAQGVGLMRIAFVTDPSPQPPAP